MVNDKRYEFILIKQAEHVWKFPAHIVAHARASYYAEGEEFPEKVYKEEYEYTIGDEATLCDWLFNNMNLEEFFDTLELIETPKILTLPDATKRYEATLLLKGEEYDNRNWE